MDGAMSGFRMSRIVISAILLVLLVMALAANGQAMEHKRYWQGTTVGMFMDIEGQQFSYVAGFSLAPQLDRRFG
jgi:hypothetical protein